MKAAHKIAFVFCLSVLIGSSAKAQQDVGAALTQVANHFGVHVEYPAGWRIFAPEQSQAILIMPETHPPINGWFTHGFVVEPFPPQKYTIEDYNTALSGDARRIVHRVFDNMAAQGGEARIIAEESTKIGGFEAYSITYELMPPAKLGTSVGKETGLFVVPKPERGKTARCFHVFAPETEWDGYKPILFAMLNSVRIQEGKEVAPQHSAVYIEPSRSLIRQRIDVKAGNVAAYDLTLPRGSILAANFQVSGGINQSIKVWLLDATNYQQFMAGQQFSYFQGTSGSVRQIASYTFNVPQTNNYNLVLDNRAALLLPRTVDLYVYALLPEPDSDQIELKKNLETSYQQLKSMFVFDDFQISIRHCGVANAFSNPNITICTEILEQLHDQNADEATAFVFFHELGHSMMGLWGLPLSDNEDVADEFATVWLILGRQQEAALKAAKYWASQTSEQEAMSKLFVDDRHTISPQRARNIIRWLNKDDDLVRRWMKIMIPNMQTAALRQMLNDPDPRIDQELVRGELAKREYAASKH